MFPSPAALHSNSKDPYMHTGLNSWLFLSAKSPFPGAAYTNGQSDFSFPARGWHVPGSQYTTDVFAFVPDFLLFQYPFMVGSQIQYTSWCSEQDIFELS